MNECAQSLYNVQSDKEPQSYSAHDIDFMLKEAERAIKIGNPFEMCGAIIATNIIFENIVKLWEGQTLKMCKEMEKLRRELTELGIMWTDDSTIIDENKINHLMKLGIDKNYVDMTMYRTKFQTYNKDLRKSYDWSVIFGCGRYGEKEELLECMSGYYDTEDYIKGHQTADEIIKAVKESIGFEEVQNEHNNESKT